jgi:SPP1 gp7 family putative phage head morphogenesis protein
MPSNAARKIHRRKTVKTAQPIKPSSRSELAYRNDLFSFVHRIAMAFDMKELKSGITDAVSPVTAKDVMTKLKERVSVINADAESIAKRFASKTSDTHKRQMIKEFQKHVTFDVTKALKSEGLEVVMQSRVSENADLIKSISERHVSRIEKKLNEALMTGKTVNLIEEIEKTSDVSRSQARLIARDQTAKFNSELNQERQTSIGVEQYVWSTSKDERVRDSHAANEGQTFNWDSPPDETGHPGDDIQCRCVALPVLPPDLVV